MPKTVWKKLESWRPFLGGLLPRAYGVVNYQKGFVITKKRGGPKGFKTYAAALAAANKQNRLEGLPEVQ